MDASALESALDNLEKSWSGLDWWLNFWTVLVILGVTIELLVLIIEYRHDWIDFRRAVIHSPHKPSVLVFGLGFLGAALVAIGIIGEFRVHIRAGKIETDLRDTTRRLVAISQKDADEARERAVQEDVKLAALQLKMLELLGPRRLTTEQTRKLVWALQGLTGKQVDVYVPYQEFPINKEQYGESTAFASDIIKGLRLAHIDSQGWKSSLCIGRTFTGVMVEVKGSEGWARTIVAALSQVTRIHEGDPSPSAFDLGGIGCAPYQAFESNTDKTAQPLRGNVHIVVGAHPVPILKPETLGVTNVR